MKILKFDTLPSTNQYLKDNYKNLENLTIVNAIHQTNGRGRLGRTWIDNNDLLFSILVKENLDNPANYSFLIASTLVKVLKEFNPLIKWPNDIIINDRKICGILLEAVTIEKIECVIIGVGINTNSKKFSNDLVFKANSLSNILESEIDNEQLLLKIADNFLEDYQLYINNESNYKEIVLNNFYLLNKEISFNYNGYENKGIVIGMNQENELLVNVNGKIFNLKSGEVSLSNIYKN